MPVTGVQTCALPIWFTLDDGGVADVAARLKKRLGTGGSARGGEILIQGDCAAKAAEALRSMGFKVR